MILLAAETTGLTLAETATIIWTLLQTLGAFFFYRYINKNDKTKRELEEVKEEKITATFEKVTEGIDDLVEVNKEIIVELKLFNKQLNDHSTHIAVITQRLNNHQSLIDDLRRAS